MSSKHFLIVATYSTIQNIMCNTSFKTHHHHHGKETWEHDTIPSLTKRQKRARPTILKTRLQSSKGCANYPSACIMQMPIIYLFTQGKENKSDIG